MADLIIDVAWDEPPNWQHVKDIGYSGAVQYFSTDASKNADPEDRDAIRAAGMWLGFVWETLANPLSTDPVWAGATANAQANQLQVPGSTAIYYAFDYDMPRSDWDAAERWLRAATVAPRPTGVYGPRLFIEEMLRRGATRYAWQAGGSTAWEGGANGTVSQIAHLYQRRAATLPNPGGSVDENVVLQPDWGGWAPGAGNQLPNIPPERIPPMARAAVPGKIIHAWGGWSPDMKIMDIFMVSDDGNLYHSWWNAAASTWYGPETLNTGG